MVQTRITFNTSENNDWWASSAAVVVYSKKYVPVNFSRISARFLKKIFEITWNVWQTPRPCHTNLLYLYNLNTVQYVKVSMCSDRYFVIVLWLFLQFCTYQLNIIRRKMYKNEWFRFTRFLLRTNMTHVVYYVPTKINKITPGRYWKTDFYTPQVKIFTCFRWFYSNIIKLMVLLKRFV